MLSTHFHSMVNHLWTHNCQGIGARGSSTVNTGSSDMWPCLCSQPGLSRETSTAIEDWEDAPDAPLAALRAATAKLSVSDSAEGASPDGKKRCASVFMYSFFPSQHCLLQHHVLNAAAAIMLPTLDAADIQSMIELLTCGNISGVKSDG